MYKKYRKTIGVWDLSFLKKIVDITTDNYNCNFYFIKVWPGIRIGIFNTKLKG